MLYNSPINKQEIDMTTIAEFNSYGEELEKLRKQSQEATGDTETTAEAIRKLGGEAVPCFGDISDFKAAQKLIRTAVDSFGSIDILVNVAGTFGFSPLWEMSEELWDEVTLTKPKGYFNCIRHAVPFMMKQKWGRIINCTSRAFWAGWKKPWLPGASVNWAFLATTTIRY
jgi:3-oxoacyl-[acyl-carrier protein] reductase